MAAASDLPIRGSKWPASLALRHGNRQEGWVEQFPVEGRDQHPVMRDGFRRCLLGELRIGPDGGRRPYARWYLRTCFGNEIVDRVLMSLSHICAILVFQEFLKQKGDMKFAPMYTTNRE